MDGAYPAIAFDPVRFVGDEKADENGEAEGDMDGGLELGNAGRTRCSSLGEAAAIAFFRSSSSMSSSSLNLLFRRLANLEQESS